VSTLTIAIGNSDDKLSQKEWAAYWRMVHDAVTTHAGHVFGVFLSASHAPYQNAAWLVQGELTERFRLELATAAQAFRQDSIAVAVGETTMVSPP
jgi:hypothetical protein